MFSSLMQSMICAACWSTTRKMYHSLRRILRWNLSEKLLNFINVIIRWSPVMAGSAVGDHGEYEIDEQDAVVQPERDEDNEPGPTNPLVQPQHEQDEEHEADEPGEERPVQHRHLSRCLLVLLLLR